MADQTLNSWRRTIRSRVVVAAAILAGWVVVIEVRLVQLQVVQHGRWQATADGQRLHTVDLPATRGAITDRHGRVLAYSVDGEAVYAVPTYVKDVAGTVRALCVALGDCTPADRAEITQRLSRSKPFVFVRHASRVSAAAARRIKDLKLPGIGFLKEPLRFYPNDELAAHVIGYVGGENKGLSGVEGTYDKTLGGRNGQVLIQVDGNRQTFASVGEQPTPGPTLQLTIDYRLQFIAEQELKAAVDYNNAKGGSVVIMDPFTGDILAMANAPSFNPNTYQRFPPAEQRNRAIQDMYEPGSTFKIVTASAAIEEGVMRPDDLVDVSAGSIRIGSRKPIFDTHRYGVLSFTDVLVKSSNVGAIKIGQRVGSERLGRYAKGFGFGTRLARDFRGENAGSLYDPAHWNESVLASVSMGYQVAVTPLQMATAASIIANGGELRQPRIVRAQVDPDGRVIPVPPRVVRRVIKPGTADQLRQIMEQVVERGTATAAKIPGYTIAGKTGTAAKLEENGHYSKSNYNGSFVGFIPSRAMPAITIIVVIDSPHGHGYYGGVVAAPVFKRIAERAMQWLGIAPNLEPARPVLVAQHDTVDAGRPEPTRTAFRPPAPAAPADLNGGTVPDVIGLSAREAIRVLARVGMLARVSGDGVVVQQDPRAGAALERGSTCALALGRLAAPVPAVSDQRQ